MNFPFFIAKKVIFQGKSNARSTWTLSPIISISLFGIALSVSIMIISVAVVKGFQSEIREKVIGFDAHIKVSEMNYENQNVINPIDIKPELLTRLNAHQSIKYAASSAKQEGVLKSVDGIYGVIAKGVSSDDQLEFFKQYLQKGDLIDLSNTNENNCLISSHIANQLSLDTGQAVVMYFFKDGKARPRKFNIAGVYETGLEKFDKTMVIIDLKIIQKLNEWKDDQAQSIDIMLNSYSDLEKMDSFIFENIDQDLKTQRIDETNAEIFGWLELQDINVVVIISLMILVCAVSMSTALLVLILDKSELIGTLKILGSTHDNIRQAFVYIAGFLLLIGLGIGNLLGLGFCLAQQYFKLIKLDQATYYLDSVPILLLPLHVLAINLGTLLLCMLIMYIPANTVAKIEPIKAIKLN